MDCRRVPSHERHASHEKADHLSIPDGVEWGPDGSSIWGYRGGLFPSYSARIVVEDAAGHSGGSRHWFDLRSARSEL